MTLYIAFDPGLSTGLAVANDTGLQAYHTIPFRDLENSLINWKHNWGELPATVIVEEYRKNPEHFARTERTGSKIETVQVIGMIKMWCKTLNIPCIEQARDRRVVGYKYWGKKALPKSDPRNHAYDAVAHLMYWMVQTKKLKVKTS